jgi:hypothetical protein
MSMRPPSLNRRRLLTWPLAAAALPAAAKDVSPAATVLTVRGTGLGPPARDGRFDFSLAAIKAMPQHRVATTTPWYKGTNEFTGPLLREVLRAAGVPAGGEGRLRCTALNDYRVEIPLDDPQRFDVVLAHLLDGKPMSVREKGPLFVMYPFDRRPELRTTAYFSRCIWQLKLIEVA